MTHPFSQCFEESIRTFSFEVRHRPYQRYPDKLMLYQCAASPYWNVRNFADGMIIQRSRGIEVEQVYRRLSAYREQLQRQYDVLLWHLQHRQGRRVEAHTICCNRAVNGVEGMRAVDWLHQIN